MRKFFISLLAAALLSTACLTPATARETAFFSAFPEDVPASALVQSAPDDAAFTAAADALASALADGSVSDERFAALLKAALDAYDCMTTACSVCELDYYRDPDANSAQYTSWSALQNQDAARLAALLQEAFASKYAAVVQTALGTDETAKTLGENVNTQAQLELLSRCKALVGDYWTDIYADYTADIGGKTFGYGELTKAYNAGDLSYDQYLDGSVQIAKAKNAAVAPLLQQLVKLHNEYAVSRGCANYAEYAYPNVFGRDYTTQDAEKFEAWVKEYIVPVCRQCGEILYANPDLSEDRLSALRDLTQQQVLDRVQPYMDGVSSEYAKLFGYMVKNRLCDLEPSAKKLSTGFTTYLPQYHSAYIYNCPVGTWDDVQTLIHEYGHFAQDCLDENTAGCVDVAETDSQGLEAMFLKFADGVAGTDGGDAYRAQTVYSLLDGIVQGCLYDEFQQRIYENGDMSVQEMNRLFRSLGEEYGQTFSTDSDEAYNWVDVSHTFEDPFYYLSYATSASAVLELLDLSESDYNAADDKYLQLVADSGEASFCELLGADGLPDVFGEKNVESLADGALRYLEWEAADVPDYTDLAGHWFESGAKLVSAEGILRGSGTSFDPDGRLTRAMFVTALYRARGGERVAGTAFSDVTDPSAWYYDAVNWASEMGYVEGADGAFSPDAPLTRQDMAVILMRADGADGEQADESVLARYADGAAISGYARAGAAYVTQTGLMQGVGGSFDPAGETTRAQAGQVFVRSIGQAA